jgi:acyl carrier protein
MLKNIIEDYLIKVAEVDPEKFKQVDLTVADLELDSLGLLEMLFEVEDKFGFQIAEPMRFLDMGFAEMVADIELAVRAHHNGQLPGIDAAPAVTG